jgi:hypothetical protein
LFRTDRRLDFSRVEVFFNVNSERVKHFDVDQSLPCWPQFQTKHSYCVDFGKEPEDSRVGDILQRHGFPFSTFGATPLTVVIASLLHVVFSRAVPQDRGKIPRFGNFRTGFRLVRLRTELVSFLGRPVLAPGSTPPQIMGEPSAAKCAAVADTTA